MHGKLIDEARFTISDEKATEYYEKYKDLIFKACRQQFEEFKKYNVGMYDAMPCPNPLAVGRLLGIMLYEDDLMTHVMAMAICNDDEERYKIWCKLYDI